MTKGHLYIVGIVLLLILMQSVFFLIKLHYGYLKCEIIGALLILIIIGFAYMYNKNKKRSE